MTQKQDGESRRQPLYLRVKEALKAQIVRGEFGQSQKLPSENQLVERFGVSRITVRQALKALGEEELIFTQQGKGTFTNRPKARQEIASLEGFNEAMQRRGYQASTKLISYREVIANKLVQTKLQLNPKQKVIELLRVRYLNQSPVSVDRSYFPTHIGYRLVAKDLESDIFPLMESELGLTLTGATVSVEARIANAELAHHLNTTEGCPIIWVERLTRDKYDRPIDFEYLAYRGDAYQYLFNLSRKSEQHEDQQEGLL